MEKIVDYLIKEKIENEDKNLFGQYSSKRLKLLSEIIALYQKENIHLAQAASILTSLVNFDMYPFIYFLLLHSTSSANTRKSIDQSQRQIADLTRKQAEVIPS